jgi:hypothetical protein
MTLVPQLPDLLLMELISKSGGAVSDLVMMFHVW